MEKPEKRRPSLRDFDYFAASVAPDADSSQFGDRLGQGRPEPGAHQPDRPQKPVRSPNAGVQPRQLVSLALTTLFVLFAGWFAWQFRDYAAYAFSPPREPLLLGSVTDMTPDMIPHNAYVSVHGITEHRGMHAKALRGLAVHHDEYWYFRLMGSRGVFIEVQPVADRYGPTSEVTVQGRAVDPDQDPLYAALLKSYETTFATDLRAGRRVIQVDFAPGEGRVRYQAACLALLACVGLFAWNGWTVVRGLLTR